MENREDEKPSNDGKKKEVIKSKGKRKDKEQGRRTRSEDIKEGKRKRRKVRERSTKK